MKPIYQMRIEYEAQPWYNEDIHYYIKTNVVTHLGTDCSFCNTLTGEVINIWERVFKVVPEYEAKAYWRNHFINNVLKKVTY